MEKSTPKPATSYFNGTIFKWIGKHYKKDQKTRLITIGAIEEHYEPHMKTIKKVYSSIQMGK